jgi:hypothetical protein
MTKQIEKFKNNPMKQFFSLSFLIASAILVAQSNAPTYNDLIKKADSLYTAGDFKNSALTYSQAFVTDYKKEVQNDYYNAACCWALINKPDNAFLLLDKTVKQLNYTDDEHILADTDLNSLHADKRWLPLLEIVKQNKEKAEAKLNKPLAAELDSIYNQDQDGRNELVELQKKQMWDTQEYKDLCKRILKADSIDLLKIEQILDQYGWLGKDVVGERGNITLFLVIQHANLVTQEKYLPMLREAVKKGNAKASHLALMEDRVALREGKKQIYGSQLGFDMDTKQYYVSPLEDPENVDKRRAEMGLPPMSEYVSRSHIKWDVAQYKKDLPAIEARENAKKKTTKD